MAVITYMRSPAGFLWKPHTTVSQMRIVDLSVHTISPGATAPGGTEMGQEQNMPSSGAWVFE